MKWIVLPYSESYFEETKYILVQFYQCTSNTITIINNTIIRITFENAYKSSIIFSLFDMPTILPNLRLMRQLSFLNTLPKNADSLFVLDFPILSRVQRPLHLRNVISYVENGKGSLFEFPLFVNVNQKINVVLNEYKCYVI